MATSDKTSETVENFFDEHAASFDIMFNLARSRGKLEALLDIFDILNSNESEDEAQSAIDEYRKNSLIEYHKYLTDFQNAIGTEFD